MVAKFMGSMQRSQTDSSISQRSPLWFNTFQLVCEWCACGGVKMSGDGQTKLQKPRLNKNPFGIYLKMLQINDVLLVLWLLRSNRRTKFRIKNSVNLISTYLVRVLTTAYKCSLPFISDCQTHTEDDEIRIVLRFGLWEINLRRKRF